MTGHSDVATAGTAATAGAAALLDASLWLGEPEGFPLAREMGVAELREEMARYGIAGGLVSHWRGKTVSAQDGNAALLSVMGELGDWLVPVWTALPLLPGEPGPLPRPLEPGPLGSPGAVRVFPRTHNFPLEAWCIGGLCSWLSVMSVPLIISHTEVEWPELYRFAREYPSLPIILDSQPRKLLYHTRALFSLMRDCPNVHVELSNFVTAGSVEYTIWEFATERLVFGSFLPVNDPLVAIGMLEEADISGESKGLIARGNLERLVGGDVPAPAGATASSPPDPLSLAMRPLWRGGAQQRPECVVDAHCHLGQPGSFFAPMTSAEDLLALMDHLGIETAICCDHVSITEGCGATLAGLLETCEGSGGRLHCLGVFHPGKAEECLGVMRQAVGSPGFVGLKLHPAFHATPADDAAYEPAWRFAAEHGLPILTHSWSASAHNPSQGYSTPGLFERWVREFAEVKLVLGHAGGRGTGRAEAARLVGEYANVYVDTAGDIFCHRLIETLVAEVGPGRVLFGSDFPWVDPRANLGRVTGAEVAEEAKARVLSGNAREVYGI